MGVLVVGEFCSTAALRLAGSTLALTKRSKIISVIIPMTIDSATKARVYPQPIRVIRVIRVIKIIVRDSEFQGLAIKNAIN